MDGFEVYNLHAEFAQKNALSIAWRFLALCPEGFFESSITVPRDNLATWDRLLVEGRRLFPMLGCDAHENVRVFGPLGGVLGTYPELLRLFSNHVLATELSAESILEALRRGRVYGVFDHLGDATGFRVSYGSPASAAPEGARAILGEQVRFEPRSTLEVRVPAESTIRLVRNGETRLEVAGTRLDETLPGPGVYRVEVYRGDALWILSGPLYVEP
jgi:hypothetical protein